MEGIVFKQLYNELYGQLFPHVPLSKIEQLAHEMWLKHSNNGAMAVEGFLCFIFELGDALGPSDLAAHAVLISTLDPAQDVPQPAATHKPISLTHTQDFDHEERHIRVKAGNSLVGVAQAAPTPAPALVIQSLSPPLKPRRRARKPTPKPSRLTQLPASSALDSFEAPSAEASTTGDEAGVSEQPPQQYDAGTSPETPRAFNIPVSLLVTNTPVRTSAATANPLVQQRRALSKQKWDRHGSLQRSQTDPTLGGLQPIGTSQALRRTATHTWDAVMPKKQPFRLLRGQQPSPLIRLNPEQDAVAGAAEEDVPFDEWVRIAVPGRPVPACEAREHGLPSTRHAKQLRTAAQAPLPCCICQKQATLWCDNCVAAFCAVCWSGMPDHDSRDVL